MNTYEVTGKIIVHSFNTKTGQESAQTVQPAVHIEAASEAAAIEQAEAQLASRAWYAADCPADDIEDIEIWSVTARLITEREKLASLPRSVAPTLPGFEAAI